MFQVGDLIIGIEENPYGITGPNSICRVIEYRKLRDNDRHIVVIYLGKRGQELDVQIDMIFPVLPEWFRKYSAKMK